MNAPRLPRLDNFVDFDLSTHLQDISSVIGHERPSDPSMEVPPIPSTPHQPSNQVMLYQEPFTLQPQHRAISEYNSNLRVIRPAIPLQVQPQMFTYYPEFVPVVLGIPGGFLASPMQQITHQQQYHPWNIRPQPVAVYQVPISIQVEQKTVTRVENITVLQEVNNKETSDEEHSNMEQTQASEEHVETMEETEILNSPETSPRCLDEETLKERAFEEYNTIMDSLNIEERHKEDEMLEELFQDDQKFLEYLEELCNDTEFVRNVGSTISLDFWSSVLSEDPDPLDLFDLDKPHREKQQSLPNNCSKSVLLAEASPNCPETPKCENKNSDPDEDIPPDALKKALEMLLTAESEISNPPKAPATVEEDYEDLINDLEETPSITTTDHTSSQDDLLNSSREIVVWPEVDAQNHAAFDPSFAQPTGSPPLLPSNLLELLPSTPDNYTPFDEDIFINFTSLQDSISNSSPLSSDLSEDFDTKAEILLEDDAYEDSYLELEPDQPKIGCSTPQSLSILALKAFLILEKARQTKEDGNDETESQKSNLPEAVSMDFGSPLQSSDTWAEEFESEIPSSEIYTDLAPKMVDVSPSSNQEGFRIEEQQATESLVEKVESRSVRRSLRLSLKMQKRGSDGNNEDVDVIQESFKRTPSESLQKGAGDWKEMNAKKSSPKNTLQDLGCRENRGRNDNKKLKIVNDVSVDFVRHRTRSADAKEILKILRPRWRSQEVIGLKFQMPENDRRVCRVKRQYVGDFSRADNFERSPKKKPKISVEGCVYTRDNESKVEARNSTDVQSRKMPAKLPKKADSTRHARNLTDVDVQRRKMAAKTPTKLEREKMASKRQRGKEKHLPAKYKDFVTCKTKYAGRGRSRRSRRK